MSIDFWIWASIALIIATAVVVVGPYLGLYGDVKKESKESKQEESE